MRCVGRVASASAGLDAGTRTAQHPPRQRRVTSRRAEDEDRSPATIVVTGVASTVDPRIVTALDGPRRARSGAGKHRHPALRADDAEMHSSACKGWVRAGRTGRPWGMFAGPTSVVTIVLLEDQMAPSERDQRFQPVVRHRLHGRVVLTVLQAKTARWRRVPVLERPCATGQDVGERALLVKDGNANLHERIALRSESRKWIELHDELRGSMARTPASWGWTPNMVPRG